MVASKQKQRRAIAMNGLSLEIVLELAKAGNESAMAEVYQRIYSKHADLEGQIIGFNEASEKYGTPNHFWPGVAKAKRIRVIKAGAHGRGNATEADARDVATFWELYQLLHDEGYLLNKVYRAASSQAVAA